MRLSRIHVMIDRTEMDIGQRLQTQHRALACCPKIVFFDIGGQLPLDLRDCRALVQQDKSLGGTADVVPIVEPEILPDKTALSGAIGNKVPEGEIGVMVPVLHHAGDIGLERITIDHQPAHGLLRGDVAEVVFHLCRGKHDPERVVETGRGIACQPFVAEDLEILCIGDDDRGGCALRRVEFLFWLTGSFTGDDDTRAQIEKPGYGIAAGYLPGQRPRYRTGYGGTADLTAIHGDPGDEAIDAVAVRMEVVEAEPEMSDQEDDQAASDADGETQDIDHRMGPVLPQLTDRDEPVVS